MTKPDDTYTLFFWTRSPTPALPGSSHRVVIHASTVLDACELSNDKIAKDRFPQEQLERAMLFKGFHAGPRVAGEDPQADANASLVARGNLKAAAPFMTPEGLAWHTPAGEMILSTFAPVDDDDPNQAGIDTSETDQHYMKDLPQGAGFTRMT